MAIDGGLIRSGMVVSVLFLERGGFNFEETQIHHLTAETI